MNLFAYHCWYTLYTTIGSGRINSESGLPDPESWESTAENLESQGVIPLLGMHLDYHRFLTDSAYLATLIYEQQGQLFDYQGTPSPFEIYHDISTCIPGLNKRVIENV